MNSAAIDFTTTFERYEHGSSRATGWRSWLWLVRAQPRLAAWVVVLGGSSSIAVALVPAAFQYLSDALEDGTGDQVRSRAIVLACLTLSAAALSWFKERVEAQFLLGVRFIACRALLSVSLRENPANLDVGHTGVGQFSTNAAQISQFGYVVDFVLTAFQSVAVGVFVVVEYRVPGLVAICGLAAFCAASVALVHRIGAIYADWVRAESARIDATMQYAMNSDRVRRARLAEVAARWVHQRRETEVPILHRRARVQRLNTLITSLAVPAVVTVSSVVLWAAASPVDALLPLLIACTILYASLQECVTNYRVIRLTVPMLTDLDARRTKIRAELAAPFSCPPQPQTGVTLFPLRTEADRTTFVTWAWRCVMTDTRSVYVPRNPVVSGEILRNWYLGRDLDARERFAWLFQQFELPADLRLDLATHRVESLSNGERHRLAAAVALTDATGIVFLDDTWAALDADTGDRILGRLRSWTQASVVLATTFGRQHVPDTELSYVRDAASHWTLTKSVQVVRSDSAELPSPIVGWQQQVSEPDALSLTSVEQPWENPRPTVRRTRQATSIVLGRLGILALVVGSIGLAALAVLFPAVIENNSHRSGGWVVLVALVSVAAMSVLWVLNAWTVFIRPEARLTPLHEQLTRRLPDLSHPANAGQLIGRLGGDFADTQMDFPQVCSRFVVGVAQLGGLVIAIGFGSWVLALGVTALLPLAIAVFRAGERHLVTAADKQAARRNDFHNLVATFISNPAVQLAPEVYGSAVEMYGESESDFYRASWGTSQARLVRRIQLDALASALLILGLCAVVLNWPGSTLVAPTLMMFYVLSLSQQLPNLIDATQGLSVSVATVSRATALLDAPDLVIAPTIVREPSERLVADLLRIIRETEPTLISVRAPTGAGKSVATRRLQEQLGAEIVSILDSDLPVTFATANDYLSSQPNVCDPALLTFEPDQQLSTVTLSSRQQLIGLLALNTHNEVLVLDESFNTLPPDLEHRLLTQIRNTAESAQRWVIYISHSEHNLNVAKVTISRSADLL